MKAKLIIVFFICCVLGLRPQNIDPLETKDSFQQKVWIDSIIKNMGLDEKIGQLFMLQAYSNLNKDHENYITEMITKYKVGNLIFMKGTPEKQAELCNKFQNAAKVPLLIGIDGEWGLDMRLKNTYRFPWNMTLGAVENDSLIKQFGEHIGKHCKRLGVHINFAPVIDINTNSNNPIIGNRSFGENKYNVSQKAISFIKGMQGVGVLSCAKHFPGHGDTATDSHHTLPVLNFDKTRLDTVELYPFKQVINSGVASVMTAHLSVPSLESKKNLPSSLSKNVVTSLLQYKLGFLGLVITDGLNMKGASNYSTSAEINLAAVQAGNDLLLIPQDIPASINLIKKAIRLKTLTEERIDISVRKILKAKYWAGLHNYKPIDLENLRRDLNTVNDELLHIELVKNSLTLLKSKENNIPIKNLEDKKIAYVSLGDDSGNYFVKMLQSYTKIDLISDDNLKDLIKKLKPYNFVIVGYHKSNSNPWKSYKFKANELVWLEKISRKKNVALCVFASPYSLLQIEDFSKIENIIVSYQNSRLSQELTAQMLFGVFSAKGRLPVSVKNYFKVGQGLISDKLGRLGYSIPESVNLSSKKLTKIDSFAKVILEEKMAPGFQILVARHGKVVLNKSYGYHTDKKEIKVKNSDLYDLASLTKILASLPLIMKAEEEQKLSINDEVQDILPRLINSNKANISVKEILSHFGNLKNYIPFYRNTQDTITNKNLSKFYKRKKSKKFKIKVAENLFLKNNYKDSILKQIKEVEQREEPVYNYSDIGYYIFQEVLESTYKKPLNFLANKMLYQSLGANRTSFLPLQKFDKKEIVPTEKDEYFRNQLIHGYVHDMGAAMLGGVGGHAGLFANANDVAKIMQMYLQKGYYGGKRYLKAETIDKFNKRYFSEYNVRRGLGFDKPQLDIKIKATCGCVSDESFGHSGFTGTYTWADPKSGILYVFLSNRVYPTMENKTLVEKNIRTEIQQAIQDAVIN